MRLRSRFFSTTGAISRIDRAVFVARAWSASDLGRGGAGFEVRVPPFDVVELLEHGGWARPGGPRRSPAQAGVSGALALGAGFATFA